MNHIKDNYLKLEKGQKKTDMFFQCHTGTQINSFKQELFNFPEDCTYFDFVNFIKSSESVT